MQEQVRKNFATFERALGLFTPFGSGMEQGETKNDHAPSPGGNSEAPAPSGSDDEIANLKAELTAMQERLDQLSRR
jgi:polyhydroxyalkanoate synthesis regulator protein